jgi:hypothetical protein
MNILRGVRSDLNFKIQRSKAIDGVETEFPNDEQAHLSIMEWLEHQWQATQTKIANEKLLEDEPTRKRVNKKYWLTREEQQRKYQIEEEKIIERELGDD